MSLQINQLKNNNYSMKVNKYYEEGQNSSFVQGDSIKLVISNYVELDEDRAVLVKDFATITEGSILVDINADDIKDLQPGTYYLGLRQFTADNPNGQTIDRTAESSPSIYKLIGVVV